jgi:expansin
VEKAVSPSPRRAASYATRAPQADRADRASHAGPAGPADRAGPGDRAARAARPARGRRTATAVVALGVVLGPLTACQSGEHQRSQSPGLAELIAEAAIRPGAPGTSAAAVPTPSPTGTGGVLHPRTVYRGKGTAYSLGGGSGSCLYEQASAATAGMYAALGDADYADTAACGAYLRVNGPAGSAVVRVVDRCSGCGAGDVALSPTAFTQIAGDGVGPVAVTWSLASPPVIGPVQFEVRDGSSAWWLGIQPRGFRNPVASLEVLVQGVWQDLARQDYDYFVAPSGFGPGPFTVRITDIYGQSLVAQGISLTPGLVQTSDVQFAAR